MEIQAVVFDMIGHDTAVTHEPVVKTSNSNGAKQQKALTIVIILVL